MQELNGYIKLYRKLIRWGWYQDNVVKSLFLHCLLMASFRDFDWMGRKLKAGQFVTSRKHLAEDLGFSEMQIRTALEKLKSTKEITCETTNRFTLITVNNWAIYQSDEESNNQVFNHQITNKQPTDNQQITNKQPHRKNVKKNKNVKNSSTTRTRVAPTLLLISSFIDENGLNVDAKKFFDYYSDKGWKTEDGKPITDWQKLLRVWDSKELKPKATYSTGYAGVKALNAPED